MISRVVARGNRGSGILIEVGESIDIEDAEIGDNGAQGILVRDVVLAGQDSGISRTSDIRIVRPHIFDNGRRVNVEVGGLEIRGRAEGVELIGGIIIESSEPSSMQRIGVSLV